MDKGETWREWLILTELLVSMENILCCVFRDECICYVGRRARKFGGSKDGKDLEAWKGMASLGKRVMQGQIIGNAEVGWTLVWVQSIKGLVW